MNKKFIAGMAALSVAASFWACGSGDIIDPTSIDVLMGESANDPENTLLNKVTANECPACFEGATQTSSSTRVRSSSSAINHGQSSSSISSSSKIEVNTSSSSSRPAPSSASSSSGGGTSSPVVNSSSSALPAGTVGTCAPQTSVIELDDTKGVTWKFERNPQVITDATQLLNASFAWTFDDGTPATASAKGAGGLTQTVKYTKSGDHGARLALSIGGSSYSIECTPVHVNGSPITGCKCTANAASVDYTNPETPGATWSVTGCSTGTGLTLSYEWNGVAGAETYTEAFTAAADSYAPTLKVYNDDNSMTNVTCSAVKITEGPEYAIKATQGAGAIKLPAGSSIVSLEVDAYNNTFFCQVAREDVPSGALNGTINGVTIKGSDYIAVSMPAGSLVKGASLEVELDGTATCGVQ